MKKFFAPLLFLLTTMVYAPGAAAITPLGDSFTFIVPPANRGAEFASVWLWLHNPNPLNAGVGDATYYIVAEDLTAGTVLCSNFVVQKMVASAPTDCGITACPLGCAMPLVLPETQTQQLFLMMPPNFGQAVRVTITYSISGTNPGALANIPGTGTAFQLGSVNHLQAEVAFSAGSQQGWDDIDFLVRDSLR